MPTPVLQRIVAPAGGRMAVSDGGIEALKWLGFVLMVADHTNRFLLHDAVPLVYEASRIAFPLFGFALAYNLARPQADLPKAQKRLLLWGLCAQPFFWFAAGFDAPLNVLLTFYVAAIAIGYVDAAARNAAALAVAIGLVVVLGFFVDFGPFGVAYLVSSYLLCRRVTAIRAATWVAMIGIGLAVPNGTYTALFAAPLILLISRLEIVMPRFRTGFYVLYVGHLVVFALWSLLTKIPA